MDRTITLPPPAVRASYIETGRRLHALAVRRTFAGLAQLAVRACLGLVRRVRPGAPRSTAQPGACAAR